MVEILQSEHVKFSSFDILTDNGVREGLKVNIPTTNDTSKEMHLCEFLKNVSK